MFLLLYVPVVHQESSLLFISKGYLLFWFLFSLYPYLYTFPFHMFCIHLIFFRIHIFQISPQLGTEAESLPYTHILGFDPQQSRNFSFLLGAGIRGVGGAEPQPFVSVLNILELNSKSICSAYDVKAYVLLTAIRLCIGMLNIAAPLLLFSKSRLMLALGFLFTLPHLTSPFIYYTTI